MELRCEQLNTYRGLGVFRLFRWSVQAERLLDVAGGRVLAEVGRWGSSVDPEMRLRKFTVEGF